MSNMHTDNHFGDNIYLQKDVLKIFSIKLSQNIVIEKDGKFSPLSGNVPL